VPPVYSIATTAFALGVTEKWIDNLLSQADVPGVVRSRQGVERGITEQGVLAIELVRLLNEELGVSIRTAAELVRQTITLPAQESRHSTPSGIEVRFPTASLEQSLRERLRDALDAVPPRKRGRPPSQKKNAGR
jgi:hypothetical protein